MSRNVREQLLQNEPTCAYFGENPSTQVNNITSITLHLFSPAPGRPVASDSSKRAGQRCSDLSAARTMSVSPEDGRDRRDRQGRRGDGPLPAGSPHL